MILKYCSVSCTFVPNSSPTLVHLTEGVGVPDAMHLSSATVPWATVCLSGSMRTTGGVLKLIITN